MTDAIPGRADKRFLRTSYGEIAYLETGAAPRPPVLFVHGIPTSSVLWRHVIRVLGDAFHCLAPDLMGLGDTDVDPETARLDMDNQAEMLLEFMTALGHERFALVCHDQGGAAAQILATRFPERLTSWVVTNCVCYDNWPVPSVRLVQQLLHLGPLADLAIRTGLMHWREKRTPFSAMRKGMFDGAALSDEAIEEYLRPLRGSSRERARFTSFFLAGSPRPTLRVAPDLRKVETPTLILWGADDRHISPSWGRRLADDIPGVEGFELIPFCGHFWQEERPAEFTSRMAPFLAEHNLGIRGVVHA